MDESLKLPELPAPTELHLPTHIMRVYEPDSIATLFRAYGLACARAALEEAAKVAAGFATCPCNGDSGYCMENDPPLAIAAAIRNIKVGE